MTSVLILDGLGPAGLIGTLTKAVGRNAHLKG